MNFSETDVDAIDVCLEGQFLVVCERNGNLHLIYVPQKRILLTRVWVFIFSYYGLLVQDDIRQDHSESGFELLYYYLILPTTLERTWMMTPHGNIPITLWVFFLHLCTLISYVIFGVCRLWWRNRPVKIRKHTAISSQRRTMHPQVKLECEKNLF